MVAAAVCVVGVSLLCSGANIITTVVSVPLCSAKMAFCATHKGPKDGQQKQAERERRGENRKSKFSVSGLAPFFSNNNTPNSNRGITKFSVGGDRTSSSSSSNASNSNNNVVAATTPNKDSSPCVCVLQSLLRVPNNSQWLAAATQAYHQIAISSPNLVHTRRKV